MRDECAENLASILNRIEATAKACDQSGITSVAAELHQLHSELNKMWVDIVLTTEAVAPIFSGKTGIGRSGEMSVMDLCYNAFMIGRSGVPQAAEHARNDWFNDTYPLMRAGVERMHKETLRRMDYAKGDRYARQAIEQARRDEEG